MASKRFEKGSEEWEFFQEFWKFVQDNFIPESNQKYWDNLTETASNIDAKYSIINAQKRTMSGTEIRLELSREGDNGRMSEDSDRIADESYSLDDIVAAHELMDIISSQCRDDVERDIIMRRIEGYSSADIGKVHGITQQGILLKIKRIRKAIAV